MGGDRIVGGDDVPSMLPWQVSLRQCTSGSCHFCGGTILDSKTVLSAAHCTPKAGQYIMAGSEKRSEGGQVSFNLNTYILCSMHIFEIPPIPSILYLSSGE